ncbi:ABC-F family ATP-binding cassette domain-containing protein [Rhodococcus triatomae]|uniref:ATPase components of ABC transporters with duplicated ATPase domains n=1 Tax=Rhodococcus triatomae TaxID=300028 RepID=A0A1G8GNR4_9NOCA|nr:ABC-F family ATP-binding cassette domain-containing protein [Rhodococcus triatomae]QNG20332.1 ABC-F family ATP-binding cassette domain-containing protein [Rhodococcus triatomae]QNG23752.1 ABC-F family ATP-binding cassette domain-containing protein [Rhodococcus triatomae]SDH96108.1 ATPase components of ABC transporters with duplicated ATPase domains [Rhodococcus triatomae]
MAVYPVVLSDISLSWPDGTPLFDSLDVTFGAGRTGIVGLNGSGKSSLLRIVAGAVRPSLPGALRPDRGSVTAAGSVAYLPQDITLDASVAVERILGIADARAALQRIESGAGSEEDFDRMAGAWDIEERAISLLHRLGLHTIVPDPAALERTVGSLSGGETVLLGLTAQLLAEPDILLLDEPTNNLDEASRAHLHAALQQFSGTVLVVGHDRELLDRMDSIAEVRDGAVRTFGGNYTHYREVIDAEQEAARAAVRDARGDMQKQKRELVEARTKIDRRARYGQKMFENKREPKIVMGARKRAAQVSAGKLRNSHIAKLEDAESTLTRAREAVRDDREIRVDLPDTRVPAGRVVVELAETTLATGQDVALTIVGPERIALTGKNGVGKSTLLDRLVAAGPRVPYRVLPQRLDVFDEEATVAENVAVAAPTATAEHVRSRLARFLFRGADADVPVRVLSGGERLRAALATVLLADPAPQLLVLDEPTNNLDLASLANLTEALADYEGALVVVSHDRRFVDDLGVTRRLELTPDALEDHT